MTCVYFSHANISNDNAVIIRARSNVVSRHSRAIVQDVAKVSEIARRAEFSHATRQLRCGFSTAIAEVVLSRVITRQSKSKTVKEVHVFGQTFSSVPERFNRGNPFRQQLPGVQRLWTTFAKEAKENKSTHRLCFHEKW